RGVHGRTRRAQGLFGGEDVGTAANQRRGQTSREFGRQAELAQLVLARHRARIAPHQHGE
ncbi:MAG: hypothetical protein ACK56I_05850, partial [bacterium]